ncbi:MAG: site-2 protease family protein [Thermotogota bacterium]
MILTIISFALIFTAIVVIHELGHFLFARLFKVRILSFGIGFGPALYRKKTASGMDFKVNLFPLGGYVRMDGEDPTEINDSISEEKKRGFYYSKPAWQRFVIALAGPAFSILAGYLLLSVVALFWGIPQVGIAKVDLFSPAQEAGLKADDIISKLNGRILFDTDELSTTIKNSESVDLTITRGDRQENITVYPKVFPRQYEMIIKGESIPQDLRLSEIKSVNGVSLDEMDLSEYSGEEIVIETQAGVQIRGILSGYQLIKERKVIGIEYKTLSKTLKSAEAPFKDGDVILRINGNEIKKGNDLFTILRFMDFPVDPQIPYHYLSIRDSTILDIDSMKSLNTVSVQVKRNGENTALEMPSEVFINALGNSFFAPPVNNKQTINPFLAVSWGFQWANNLLRRMGTIIANIFTGEQRVSEFSGPVGIVNVIGQATRAGFESLVLIFALITLNLGIINLIPLPALDGGRIVFNLIEMFSRKKINPVIEGYIHAAGFFFIMALAVYITYFDIMRFMR